MFIVSSYIDATGYKNEINMPITAKLKIFNLAVLGIFVSFYVALYLNSANLAYGLQELNKTYLLLI